MREIVKRVLNDVNKFCDYNSFNRRPTWFWIAQQLIITLKKYPSGVTSAILITELESNWRSFVNRGMNTGRMNQILKTRKMSLFDIVTGELKKIDNFRFSLLSEEGSINLIIHRQFMDWFNFISHYQFDLFITTRKCRLTHCRLSRHPELLLLPTSLLVFILSISNPFDGHFVFSTLKFLHESNCTCRTTLPIDTGVTGVFAEVIDIGSISAYRGPSNAKQYVLVRLKIYSDLFRVEDYDEPPLTTFLVLYDEQVDLVNLLNIGEMLWIFRPCYTLNSDEFEIFGHRRFVSAPMAYICQHNTDEMIINLGHENMDSNHGYNDIQTSIPNMLPYHIIYGSVTSISIIEGLTHRSHHSSNTTSSTRNGEPIVYIRNSYLSQYCDSSSFLNAVMPETVIDSSVLLSHFEGMSITEDGYLDMSRVSVPVDPLLLMPRMVAVTVMARLLAVVPLVFAMNSSSVLSEANTKMTAPDTTSPVSPAVLLALRSVRVHALDAFGSLSIDKNRTSNLDDPGPLLVAIVSSDVWERFKSEQGGGALPGQLLLLSDVTVGDMGITTEISAVLEALFLTEKSYIACRVGQAVLNISKPAYLSIPNTRTDKVSSRLIEVELPNHFYSLQTDSTKRLGYHNDKAVPAILAFNQLVSLVTSTNLRCRVCLRSASVMRSGLEGCVVVYASIVEYQICSANISISDDITSIPSVTAERDEYSDLARKKSRSEDSSRIEVQGMAESVEKTLTMSPVVCHVRLRDGDFTTTAIIHSNTINTSTDLRLTMPYKLVTDKIFALILSKVGDLPDITSSSISREFNDLNRNKRIAPIEFRVDVITDINYIE